MPITLNEGSFQYARRLIAGGRFVADEPDLWNEHRPSAGRENAFIEEHGMDEYDSGIWVSMTSYQRTRKRGTSFLTVTSTRCTPLRRSLH